MSLFSDFNRKFNLVCRLALTIAVGSAATVSLFLVSGSVKAVEDINRTDDTLAELSQYIAEGHASIRGLVATPGSSAKAALVSFEKAVDRRIETLNTLVKQRAGAYQWTQPLQDGVDVQRIDNERREYVTAGTTAPMAGFSDSAMGLRMFDLRARKLIVTVAAMRDNADTARAHALFAAEEITALSSAFGGMLIAYLIWFPVFARKPEARLA